ncbi:VWA domain-containing protein [Clostridium chromiireducens]|uniref:von Willebrand factor type A domain protein n=1 Tax=Clostridium chromiireducens TaxID=225345 RepID=A0A1V4IJQ6_9CLOT|nr:VWA domain-containing protein [Clostridium chromiireducens]OPJ60070.1 von Willebrand factor type A domain protein [Clostridium chromiireducens]
MKIKMKYNKKYGILSFIMVITFILNTILALRVNATVNPPQINVNVSLTPNPAQKGQPITVRGTITPQQFETDIPNKEIVLVLDVSGSMKDEVTNLCDNTGDYYCDDCRKYLDETPEEHKNEQPYINHTVTSYWWGKNYYYCNDCREWIDEDQQTHRNAKPYFKHNIRKTTYCSEHNKNGAHKSTKIYELKKAAKNFVDKMKNVPNLKIGIVTYSDTADIEKASINNNDTALIPAAYVDQLNEIIDDLNADGGTNTGEGLRKATYLLSKSNQNDSTANKTVILMSDGIPTFYTKINNSNNNYYLNTDTETTGTISDSGDGKADTSDFKDLKYAKAIGEIIKNKGYNAFCIGYGMNNDGVDRMRQIQGSMTGKNMNDTSTTDQQKGFYPTSDGSIEGVFGTIADQIIDTYTITNVKFNLNLPSEFQLDGGGNIVSVDNITYRKVSQTGNKIIYNAQPVPFSFTLNATRAGTYTLFNDSTLTYQFNGTPITNDNINSINITITDTTTATSDKVTMKVSDSSGTINKIYDSTVNTSNYVIDNNGEVYKLYGKANVSMNVANSQATDLKYRFVKEGQESSESDWQYIALTGDVDTAHPGYLTQMPYDVSHMPLMSNDAMWSNRNEVYKTPFADKTGLISTGVTSANAEYVTSENVRNKDGNIITRWVPKTLFVNNQYVEAYASGYKESRKTWGYIKVNQTGNYYFKAYSDDGFYGTITVNGELKVLGDSFEPRGVSDSGLTDTNAIALVKDVYYPIYLEYFNWGGSAAFRIESSLGNKNNYQLIGSSSSNCTLYPSKSDSPIETGNNIFMGATTVNFKTEPGIYTIEYALLKEKSASTTSQTEYDEISTGSFGKFEVEERFNELSKSFSKNPIEKGEHFNINYTLTPKPIKLTDLYKGNDSSNKPSSLYVKNVILTDELPQGLVLAETTNSTSINKVADIEYKYNSQSDKYEANEYTFNVSVKPKDSNVDSVSFNESGQIDYRDISLKDDSRISQTQYFQGIPTLNFIGNSLITKHGLFNGSTVTDNTAPVDVVASMNYTFGFVIDVKGSINNFTLKCIPNNVNIDSDNICIYELDENENVIISSKKIISGTKNDNIITVNLINNSQSLLDSGKKYAVIYKVNSVNGDAALTAQLDTGDYRNLKLKLKTNLPELF